MVFGEHRKISLRHPKGAAKGGGSQKAWGF